MFFGNAGRAVVPTRPFGNHPTLVEELFAYWRLEESAGDFADAHTFGLTLTRNGAMSQITGKHNRGLFVTGLSGAYLSNTSSALFGATAYLTYSFWMYHPISTTVNPILAYSAGTTDQNYAFQLVTSTNFLHGRIFDTSSSYVETDFSSDMPDSEVWNHYIWEIDPVTKTTTVTINNSSTNTSSALSGTIRTNAQEFYLSVNTGGTIRMDEVGFWRRALTTSEKAALYNNGVGLFY